MWRGATAGVRGLAGERGPEGLAQVAGQGAGGGDDVRSVLDLYGALPAGGADESADRPAGAGFDPAADGQRAEHDRQAGFDGGAPAVADGPGLQGTLARSPCPQVSSLQLN